MVLQSLIQFSLLTTACRTISLSLPNKITIEYLQPLHSTNDIYCGYYFIEVVLHVPVIFIYDCEKIIIVEKIHTQLIIKDNQRIH